MSAGLLKSLKENKIESCLMVDGFDNKPVARRYVKNFIHSATFDPNDSENYEMRLINLFAEDIFFNKENLIALLIFLLLEQPIQSGLDLLLD